MRRRCWWHGADCPDRGRCKRVGNYDPPADDNKIMSLHRPNRYGSLAEEAHCERNPGVPWDGIVADLGTAAVRERWANWGTAADGRQGPVVKNGSMKEPESLAKIAGVRMAEPGEILRQPTARERMKASGRKLSDYLRRA